MKGKLQNYYCCCCYYWQHLVDDVPAGKEDVVAAANGLEDGGTMYLHCASRQDRQESLGTMGEEAPLTHNCKISGRGSVATGNK